MLFFLSLPSAGSAHCCVRTRECSMAQDPERTVLGEALRDAFADAPQVLDPAGLFSADGV